MNKSLTVFAVIMLTFVAVFSVVTPALAHPGRTDSSGGHTCYTNCEYWGYEYGEYHYHGGYDDVDYYDQGYEYGSSNALDNNRDYITSNAESDGREAGYDAGYAGESEDYDSSMSDSICDITFNFDVGATPDWQDGVYEGYAEACRELASEFYQEAYSEGYGDGYAEYESGESEYSEDELSEIDYSQLFGWMIIVGIVGVGIYGVVTER